MAPRRSLWACAVVLLASGLSVAAAAGCPAACALSAKPVCGEDGMPYLSACVAACAGVRVKHEGYCAKAPGALKFSVSADGRPSRKERAAAVTRDVMEAYKDAGFVYLGRVKLAAAPSAPAAPARSARGSKEAAFAPRGGSARRQAGPANGTWAARGAAPASASPGWSVTTTRHALRYTPSGDVYYSALGVPATMGSFAPPPPTPMTLQSASFTAAADVLRIPPTLPPAGSPYAYDPSLSDDTPARRRLRMIIGTDERQTCGQPPRFPLTAVGQLDFITQNQDYICSGALVRKDKVLTAAHCVWSVAERTFVRGIGFAAGRFRTAVGEVVSPFGVQGWKHVTLISDLPSAAMAGSDMAVIALDSDVSPEAGTMGVDAACGRKEAQGLEVETAGYASDKFNGQCVMDKCHVSWGCGAEATQHTCDTFMGQSGSPFWDHRMMVRGVHVRGMPTVNEFSNVNAQTLRSILAS